MTKLYPLFISPRTWKLMTNTSMADVCFVLQIVSLLLLTPGCTSQQNRRVFSLSNGCEVSFVQNISPPPPTVLSPPSADFIELFNRKPELMIPLANETGPWLFLYCVNCDDSAWPRAKGPMTVHLDADNYMNFSYIVEDYDKNTGLTMEYLKLGKAFVARYFIPISRKNGHQILYIIGLYGTDIPNPKHYRKLRKIVSSLRIHQEGEFYEF